MKARIYIDTSIVGGFFDKEFEKETKALFEQLESNKVVFVISDLLLRELESAPKQVRTLLEKYTPECFEPVVLTEEAEELANCYIEEKVIGQTSRDDCRHIAIATINKADILARWNMKAIDKNFNCLEMKSNIQAQVYAETNGMSFDELKNYFNSCLKNNSFWKKINTKRV